jgi:hypothetical protein
VRDREIQDDSEGFVLHFGWMEELLTELQRLTGAEKGCRGKFKESFVLTLLNFEMLIGHA